MNKQDFLRLLKEKMSGFPASEIEKALHFYEETIQDRIEDGYSETDAVAALGNVEDILAELKLDLPLTTLVSHKVKENRERSSNKSLWLILVILGSPLWIPLVFAFLGFIITILIALWSIGLGLLAIFVASGFGAILSLYASAKYFLAAHSLQGMAAIGLALILGGVFLLLLPVIKEAFKQFANLSLRFLRKIKSLFISKEAKS